MFVALLCLVGRTPPVRASTGPDHLSKHEVLASCRQADAGFG